MRRVCALGFFFLILSPSVLCAQSTNASLSGRIADPSKAIIAEAKVTAVCANTGARYEATTSPSGEYALANLPPGTYRVEVEKSGFKKSVRSDVTLHVQDVLSIDFEMVVGSVSDTVSVEADAPLIDGSSGTVSTVVNHAFVENMPLNGRSFQTLIMLTPGVVVTATAFDDQGQFSVNGQRADANYFTVDGVSANFGVTGYFPLVQTAGGALPALSAFGGTSSLVSVDALQEFRVQTSSFAPEFGRMPGGQISIVTRSGTNQFHGTLFEYFRNDVLDAKDWFADFNHLPKPAERQNDFGGVFGGPILKDKTFFFFSYEGLRLRQPATQETVVPDDVSRQQAPASMQPFLNAFPVANGAELGAGLAQFNASYSNPSSLNAYSIRVDHIINSKLNMFARYSYSPSSTDQRDPFGVLSTTESLSSSVQAMTVGFTHLIKPQISNEMRVNYSNQRVSTKLTVDHFGGAIPIPDSELFPNGFSSSGSNFQLLIDGVGSYSQGLQGIDEQRQVNVIDNISISHSGHQMKFGLDYRRLSPFSRPNAYNLFVELAGVTCPAPPSPCTGNALSGTAEFALVTSLQTDSLLGRNLSLYAQDTWKMTPRITVTYGLRWDMNPPLKGEDLANQPFTVTGLKNPATLALAPRGTPLYDTTYGNLAPRLGVAYQLRQTANWETVLRGGFGVFYDIGYGSLGGVSSFFPYQSESLFVGVPFPLSSQNATPPVITTSPPVNTILVADPHLELPRTYQWNAALEQSFGNSQSLSLTYIGAVGRKLLRATNLFNPNPDFQAVSLTDNSSSSDYHALQLKFQRRFSHGLQALASYTFSHSIDIASTDAVGNYLNTPGGGAYQNLDRGNSDFDIRHSFTAGVTYDLPRPGEQKLIRAVFGGWSVDAIILARSAPPVNIVGAPYFGPGGTALFPRPNLVPGQPLEVFGPQYPGGKIFNSAAFMEAAPGTQGDFGRNVLRGFGATQADVAVQRQFHLTERFNLRFRSEFFNIFNHPNFGNPNNNLTDPLFGHSTQTLASFLGSGGANGGFSPLYQIGGPRSIQLALKLQF